MTIPQGVAPSPDLPYRLKRDDTIKVAGVPFKRQLVYEIDVPLPLPSEGTMLFAVDAGFTISSILVRTSHAFEADAAYVLFDASDAELIGIVTARAGNTKQFPLTKPAIQANLDGPSTVLMKYTSGVEPTTGHLTIQISAEGRPSSTGAGIDANGDGVPDELAEQILPAPPFLPLESFDDFYGGYQAGVAGETEA
jgi:hypothetical protein